MCDESVGYRNPVRRDSEPAGKDSGAEPGFSPPNPTNERNHIKQNKLHNTQRFPEDKHLGPLGRREAGNPLKAGHEPPRRVHEPARIVAGVVARS